MPEIETGFSPSAVYLFLFIGVLILVFFRLINFFVPVLPLKADHKAAFRRLLPIIEFVGWFVFLIWGIGYFFRYNIYFALGLGVIAFLIMLWFAWFALRDLIAGMVIKSNRALKINDTVDVAGYHGKIKRFGFRNLVVETENGKNIYLPYTMLIKQEIVRSHPAEKILSHSFQLQTEPADDIQEKINEIRKSILSLPWVSMIKEPLIRLQEEKNNRYLFHITVYSIEKDYFMLIEKELRSQLEAP